MRLTERVINSFLSDISINPFLLQKGPFADEQFEPGQAVVEAVHKAKIL